MRRLALAERAIEWDADALPSDPFGAALPLDLGPAVPATGAAPERPADISLVGTLAATPAPNPVDPGAASILFHGSTRCFRIEDALVLWDGASILRVDAGGRRIDARVHASSLEAPSHFSSVTVTMALLLALRHRGLFHLHAAAARWPDGETWVMPGESGSGKSTLALALFAAGARWLGDDILLLRSVDRIVEVVGWARKMRVTAQTAAAFPALRSWLSPCAAGSARDFELDPRDAFPGAGLLAARAPFTLVFPRIGNEVESRMVPLGRADAFGRALHACAWVASEHLPRQREQLDLLARLVDGARAFDLALGSGVLVDPRGAVEEIRRRAG